MRRRTKVLTALFAVPAVGISIGMMLLAHDRPCPAPTATPSAHGGATMRAVVYRCYGSSAVLDIVSVPRPVPAEDEVLVRVHAVSINPAEWHYMTGEPYVMRLVAGVGRPSDDRLGSDFAGTVEAVGAKVTRYRRGDSVFGARSGAFAEYVTVREDRIIAPLPAGTKPEEAAGVGIAATTALQAVRDYGRVRPGQRVLINGASGGVGSFAVQIAQAHGAQVTGVSSTRNLALVRSLGAEQTIDYTREDFTRGVARYDVIIDMVGNHRLRDLRQVLAPDGVVVVVGGPKDNRWLGPLTRSLLAAAYSPFVPERFVFFTAEMRPDDLDWLANEMAAGRLRTNIDRSFTMDEVRAAMDYLAEGRTRGKSVILMGEGSDGSDIGSAGTDTAGG